MEELKRLYGIYDKSMNQYVMTFNCDAVKRIEDVLSDFIAYVSSDDDEEIVDVESLQVRFLGHYDETRDIPYILNSTFEIVFDMED